MLDGPLLDHHRQEEDSSPKSRQAMFTANNQLVNNQHAMEWDPHSHVGYSSSHVGYAYVGYSYVVYSHNGYSPHVGCMGQRYDITNLHVGY